jgi:hypothetical protein
MKTLALLLGTVGPFQILFVLIAIASFVLVIYLLIRLFKRK